jgi:hypothetical protein
VNARPVTSAVCPAAGQLRAPSWRPTAPRLAAPRRRA